MPRQSLQLNDFSGGLNTKSSPRDINPNQVQKADNVFLSNPGVLKGTSDATAKSSSETMTHAQAGNGAFIFNSESNVDTSGGASTNPSQIIAFPIDKGSTDNTTIQFFRRDFDTTGNFSLEGTDTEIDMQVTGAVKPVYYFVDGVLYVSDKLIVDSSVTSEPRKLVYIKNQRFAENITGWLDTTTKVELPGTPGDQFHSISDASLVEPDTGEFSVFLETNPALDSQDFTTIVKNGTSNKLITTTNPDETNPDPTNDIGLTDKTIYLTIQGLDDNMSSTDLNYNSIYTTGAFTDTNMDGNIIYINGEAIRVRGVSYKSTDGNTNDILQLVVDRAVYSGSPSEHAGVSEVKVASTSKIAVTSGGWEAGSYEFCHSVIDLQNNETLPQSPQSSLFPITTGAYFTNVGFMIKDGSFSGRKNEKGVRIYTRKKDGNGRWILFLDVDYQRGVRSNLFEEYTAFTDGQGTGTNFAKVINMDMVNPSLDTYESINGYSQDEESIDFGVKGGYKAATVCARRAWVANVRKGDVVFDDRIYYSPVNKFSTFPDTYFLDIGISDGDSFTALHSLGNRLLAFKQKKLYVINISSTSDAGWYLEAEYDGMGCRQQESVCKTPFGVSWVNDDGVYMFDGQSMPKELTLSLDDKTWRTNQLGKNPCIGYNNKYKQIAVVQDSNADTDLFVFDFATQGWSLTKSIGTNGVSNFLPSFDGLYYFEYVDGSHSKVLKLLTGDSGSKAIDLRTKDLDFGNPGLVKKIKKVYISAKDAAAGTTLTLSYALDGSTTFTALSGQVVNHVDYQIKSFTINQDCQSLSLKVSANNTIDINDINIDYRQTNKRPS
jgi:hypothetical protein